MISPGPITIDGLRVVRLMNDAYRAISVAPYSTPEADRKAHSVLMAIQKWLHDVDTLDALQEQKQMSTEELLAEIERLRDWQKRAVSAFRDEGEFVQNEFDQLEDGLGAATRAADVYTRVKLLIAEAEKKEKQCSS